MALKATRLLNEIVCIWQVGLRGHPFLILFLLCLLYCKNSISYVGFLDNNWSFFIHNQIQRALSRNICDNNLHDRFPDLIYLIIFLFSQFQFHSIYCVMLSFFFCTWHIQWSKKRSSSHVHQYNVIEREFCEANATEKPWCAWYNTECQKIMLYHRAHKVLDFLGWNVIFCL